MHVRVTHKAFCSSSIVFPYRPMCLLAVPDLRCISFVLPPPSSVDETMFSKSLTLFSTSLRVNMMGLILILVVAVTVWYLLSCDLRVYYSVSITEQSMRRNTGPLNLNGITRNWFIWDLRWRWMDNWTPTPPPDSVQND